MVVKQYLVDEKNGMEYTKLLFFSFNFTFSRDCLF